MRQRVRVVGTDFGSRELADIYEINTSNYRGVRGVVTTGSLAHTHPHMIHMSPHQITAAFRFDISRYKPLSPAQPSSVSSRHNTQLRRTLLINRHSVSILSPESGILSESLFVSKTWFWFYLVFGKRKLRNRAPLGHLLPHP